MIFPHALTDAERRKSQKNYYWFGLLNGVSYMCLGETIIILFAVKLNASNSLVAILGSLIYFSYVMLPLGKMVAAKVGAAGSQAIFWTARNIAALLVAASAVVSYWNCPRLALAMVLVGACLFYGFRAAGVVMCQPLLGDIALPADQAEVMGRSNALFYVGCIASLLGIWFAFRIQESIWMLAGIIVFGACVGVTSTRFIWQIDESSALRKAARRSLLAEMREVWRIPAQRIMVLATFCVNLATIMVVPVSMLAAKRGYGVSDGNALYFSMAQFGAAAVSSFASGAITNRLGAKRAIIFQYAWLLLPALMWILAPKQISFFYTILIFIPAGGAAIAAQNATTSYFLFITPQKLQVAGAMLLAVAASVGAGVTGMVLSGSLFKLIEAIGSNGEPLAVFKVYYLVVLLFFWTPFLLFRKLQPCQK